MSWLKYLQETLGVHSVLWPQASAPALEGPAVVFFDIQPWSAKEAALFEKMRAAMKLSPSQIKVVFSAPEELAQKSQTLSPASCWVFFSPELATQAGSLGNVFTLTTFGPRELLQSPQLKKQSWDDLQKIMKKLE